MGQSEHPEEPVVPNKEPGADPAQQALRLSLTDGKIAELRLPLQLNEQDLVILRAQLNVLEAQVQVNKPVAPLRWTSRQERSS
jgi:hypothetical protein